MQAPAPNSPPKHRPYTSTQTSHHGARAIAPRQVPRRDHSEANAGLPSRTGQPPFFSSQYPSQWPSHQLSHLPRTTPASRLPLHPSPTRRSFSDTVPGGGETWSDFLRSTANSRQSINVGNRSKTRTTEMSSNTKVTDRTTHVVPRASDAGTQSKSSNDVAGPTINTSGGASRLEGYRSPGTGYKRAASDSDSWGQRRSGGGPSAGVNVYYYGASASSPIDLTSPERPVQRSRPGSHQEHTNSGDIVLPQWQSDVEVVSCPVCRTQFNFWYRRHHCRKCGKVVCAACSQHRITIPRQFIVQPPSGSASPLTALVGSPNGSDNGTNGRAPQIRTTSSATVSGSSSALMTDAELVRVCNPCVPDPNLSPPPQQPTSAPAPVSSSFFANSRPAVQEPRLLRTPSMGPPPIPQRYSSAIARDMTTGLIAGSMGSRPEHGPSSSASFSSTNLARRAHASASYNAFMSHPHTHHDAASSSAAGPSSFNSTNSRLLAPSHPRSSSQFHQYRSSAHAAAVLPRNIIGPHYRPVTLDVNAPLPLPPHMPSYERLPRRQINEDDECPVCGQELPPKGRDGDEKARTQHVEECIRQYSSVPLSSSVPHTSSATSNSTVVVGGHSAADEHSGSNRSVAGGLMAPGSYSSTASPSQQQQRTTGNRMLVYQATEKDCVGEDGAPQECVICFDEFEVGVEMGVSFSSRVFFDMLVESSAC